MTTRAPHDSEQQFRTLVERSLQGILVHRGQQPLFVNEAWAALHGYTASEVLAMDSVLPLIDPDDRQRMLQYMRARMEGGDAPVRYEYRGVRKDGTTVWLENMVSTIAWDGRPAILATILDIGERKQTEDELRRIHEELERRVDERTAALQDSEALYHSLVDSLSVCILRKDLEGRFTFANKAFLELTGLQFPNIVGRTDFDLYPHELAEKYRQDDARVIETGEPFEDVEQNEQEGAIHWVRVRKSPVHDARGRTIGVQAIFWDVTERKLADEEIRLKNRDLETLLYVLSHDLREPLRAIESFSKLVVDRYTEKLDEKGQDFLSRVIGGASRMNRLLDDVLILSRAQRMEQPSETVPAREIVDDVLKQLRLKVEETGAVVSVADSLPNLRVDRRWATQAVFNLVANALKFTKPGEPPNVEIAGYRRHKGEPPGAGLVVRDHGPGVDANHAERIFNLFQRAVGREVEGTGAGLAIVRQIAERHQGRAWVRTGSKHDGAEFVVTFGGTPK